MYFPQIGYEGNDIDFMRKYETHANLESVFKRKWTGCPGEFAAIKRATEKRISHGDADVYTLYDWTFSGCLCGGHSYKYLL